MPAEWVGHDACLMAWPTRPASWGGIFDRARREFAGVADAIAAFEPVIMVTAPGTSTDVRRAVTAEIEVVEFPLDDSWMRDSGPIFVLDTEGRRAAVDFRFNSWGERFLPYDDDARVSERILGRLRVPRIASEMVLEGGSIAVDGEGTLITTEQCLLHPNRNPSLSRDEIETELKRRLGVNEIVWLPYGHADDLYTDGHVDGVCAFTAPGRVVVQSCLDSSHPDYQRMAANLQVLRTSRDAAGRQMEILELPFYPYVNVAGTRKMVSYVNFYLPNGGVVVPFAGHPDDEEARRVLAEAFPMREVVGVPAAAIAYGGGGVHCITQQLPSVTAT
jgi:agmatine deiminase